MKVTICSHDGKAYFGGPYEWIKRFGPALRHRGIEVSFLFYSDHSAEESSTYIFLKKQGFNCQLLKGHSLSQYNDNTETRVRWFLQQVKQNSPDVFIANAVLPALYAGKWIRESGIPVIGILHTDDPAYEWFPDEFLKCKEFVLSALVCVSDLLREKMTPVNVFNIPIKTISCGTPIPDQVNSKDPAVLKLVYVGKLTEKAKQVSLLTHALCRAVKEIDGVEAYIYGDGPARKDVLHIIASEAKSYPVFYKGFVESADIQKEISDKHVIVLLSDYEGLPIVLLEGMVCGLVPVCLDIRSGIPEIVKHGETGLLVKDRGESFIEMIRKLKEDASLYAHLSLNASTFVRQHHAMDVITEKWIDLCSHLIKKSIPKKELQIPNRITLPPVHALLKMQDDRKVSLLIYIKKQLSRFKHRLRKS